MPVDLYGKLWMLHHLNKEVEFSGLLFYSVEGELHNPETFKVQLKDFYLMDIGTKAYTEFEFQNKMFNLYDEKPELLQYQYGLLHSHNSMQVFFSGTDTTNLLTEAVNFNQYLSVIINIEGDLCGKISSNGKIVNQSSTTGITKEYHKDTHGKLLLTETPVSTTVDVEEDVVFVYNCSFELQHDFATSIARIKKEKEVTSNANKSWMNDYTSLYEHPSLGRGILDQTRRSAPYTRVRAPQLDLFDDTPSFQSFPITNNVVVDFYESLFCEELSEIRKNKLFFTQEIKDLTVEEMIGCLYECGINHDSVTDMHTFTVLSKEIVGHEMTKIILKNLKETNDTVPEFQL